MQGMYSASEITDAGLVRREHQHDPVRRPGPTVIGTVLRTGGSPGTPGYGCCNECIPRGYMTLRSRFASKYYVQQLPTLITSDDDTTILAEVEFNYSGVSGDDIASIAGIADGMLIYESDFIEYECAEGVSDAYYYLLVIDPNDCLAVGWNAPPNASIHLRHDGSATNCPDLSVSCTDSGDTGDCPGVNTALQFTGSPSGIGAFTLTHSAGCSWTGAAGAVSLTFNAEAATLTVSGGGCTTVYAESAITQVGSIISYVEFVYDSGDDPAGCGWPSTIEMNGEVPDGAGALLGPIYANIGNDFRARCGTSMQIVQPQRMAERLEDILQCTVCVYPKAAAPVVPLTTCLQNYMAEVGRTTLPGMLALEILSWSSEGAGIEAVNQTRFGLFFSDDPIEQWIMPHGDTGIVLEGGVPLSLEMFFHCYPYVGGAPFDEFVFTGRNKTGGLPDDPFFTWEDSSPTYGEELHLTASDVVSLSNNPIDITFDVKLILDAISGPVAGHFQLRIYEP